MSNVVITPTPGRVLWYYPSRDEIEAKQFACHDTEQPLAAIVAYAWSHSLVNLGVIDQNGRQFPRTSVLLVQEGEEKPALQPYATWMPYQLGQAAKAASGTEAPTDLIGVDLSLIGSAGMDPAAPGADQTVETKVYTDSTTATGTAPLPDESPAQQEAGSAPAEDAAPTESPTAQEPVQA